MVNQHALEYFLGSIKDHPLFLLERQIYLPSGSNEFLTDSQHKEEHNVLNFCRYCC